MNIGTNTKFNNPDQQGANDHHPLAVVSELHSKKFWLKADLDFISTLCNNISAI
jgi:hypothetical protein